MGKTLWEIISGSLIGAGIVIVPYALLVHGARIWNWMLTGVWM